MQAIRLLKEKELEKKASEIRDEGLLLYRSEKASWIGTDIFMEKYPGDKSQMHAYFSYIEGPLTKFIFYSKDSKVIATITFDNIIVSNHAVPDFSVRDFTELEKAYYNLRQAAEKAISGDTLFKYYEKTNLNLVCVIDDNRKDVYALTGTAESGLILFGNDYLLRFDKSYKNLSKEPLHRSLIPLHYPSKEPNTMGMVHTHLPEFSPFITPTDICTGMLYKDFSENKIYTTVSADYLSIWNCESMHLAIIPMKTVKKIVDSDEKKNK